MKESLYCKIPKIYPGIVIHQRDNEYIIAFRDNNSHLKINSKLFDLLCFIDNKRSLSQIVSDFNNTFEIKINNEFAYDLLYNKLGYYNIIENDIEKFNPHKPPSYLKLNTILINDRFTKIIAKPFLFLFKNLFLKITSLLCLAAILITFVIQYTEIISCIKHIPAKYIIIYVIVMIVSSFLHELGHSAATYSFGGKHSGIGIGFYLFTPVLYSDVSDAWKFNVKKRIIINLAGIYFELIFSTALILVALITGIKSLLIIPVIIFLKTLFNLNPFFRTDGYWILSDLIRVPNLRLVSNDLLKKIFIKSCIIQYTRKNIFLIIYALISNAFIVMLLITLFIINPNSLLTFPNDAYIYITDLINNNIYFSLTNFSKFLIPLTFYYLLIRLIISSFKKYYNKKNNIHQNV